MNEGESQAGRLQILRAGVEDVDRATPLFDAYRSFYGQRPDPEGAREFLERRLGRSESVVLLAVDESRSAVGFVQLYPTFSSVSLERRWTLNDLFVAPGCRKRGVGQALLTAARDFAQSTGAGALELETGLDNHAARALYESLGWERETESLHYSLKLR